MAARTFTSAGVNNLWSNAANWDGGLTIPQEDDSVTIPSGQTCEYDYNSAYTTGIAGITITGTLSLTRTAGTYRLFMKAGTTIGGAGTFDCGTSVSPIPAGTNHTITGGAGWYITGATGLTMTAFAVEPTIRYVQLTQEESIGATVLHVDKDVTGDIWKDGDTISIAKVNGSYGVEEKVIATGGITASTITVTTGLTAAKYTYAPVALITRNLSFIAVGTGTRTIYKFAAGKMTVGGGSFSGVTNKYLFDSCPGMTVTGGVFSKRCYVFFSCSDSSFSNFLCSDSSAIFYATNYGTIDNLVACGCGSTTMSITTPSITNSKIFGANIVFSSTQMITAFNVDIYGADTISTGSYTGIYTDCTFNHCLWGFMSIVGDFQNCTFTDFTTSVMDTSIFRMYNTSVDNFIIVNYTKPSKFAYSFSVNHNGMSGNLYAVTKGGVTSSLTATPPTGYTQYNNTALESSINIGFWQKEVLVSAGASINMDFWLRKDASMAYLPNCIVFDKADTDPFMGGAGLKTFTMTDSINTWENNSYVYTNTGVSDVTLVVRFQGKNATGNMLSALALDVINVDLTSALAKLDAIKAKTDVLKNPTLLIDNEIIV